MLRWLLAICLLSAANARVLLRPRELELGWPFQAPNAITQFPGVSGLAPYIRTFPDQCMLWDNTCSSNKTEALDEFFNNSGTMYQLVYGAWEYYPVHRERDGIPPDTNSKIISWMREPDCRSSFLEWHTENPDQSSWSYTDWADNTDLSHTIDWSSIATTSGTFGCCDACELVGGNVDVYYWPVPGANTDCLASVGTTAASDIDLNLVITDARRVGGGGWWNPQSNPYGTFKSPSSSSNPAPPLSIVARGHALLSAPGNGSESRTIAVQNGFTFTSPSIYVGFSTMYAVDRCGAIGTLIPYTMLAFAPEELSTIELPAWDRGNIPSGATKSFNFADLPCPPQSVMIADQYKPAPGSPYRPVLSPPEQIYRLQPGWSDCVITHAFAGIDPPRSLTPAAALVPNLTPTSPQSPTTGTTSTSSLRPVPGAAEAGATGTSRDPPPAPAHKVQTAGPRSTPSRPSPSTAKNDSLTPETSLDPQDAQPVKTHSKLNGWQTLISPEAASEIQASSMKARDSSVQDPSRDRSFISDANTDIPKKVTDAFQPLIVSSDRRSDMKSAFSPNAVISDPLPTHGEEYEEGASRPFAETTRIPSSEDGRGQTPISVDQNTLPRYDSLPQENKYPQITNAAEPGSPRLESQLNDDISTENRDPSNQINGNADRPSTRVTADLQADPTTEVNTARNPGVGFPSRAALQNSPYTPLPDEQVKQQPQTSSPNSNANGALTSARMVASNLFLVAKPDPLTSATLIGSEVILQTKSDSMTSATSIAFNGDSELKPDSLINLPLSTGMNPTMSISDFNTHGVSAPAIITAFKASPHMTPDLLPTPSVPSSDLQSVLADANTLSDPQSKPSNSVKAILGSQTAPAFKPSGTLTTGMQARASSVSKNVLGGTTVLPFKNGAERSTRFCVISSFVCLASLFLLFLV